MLEFYPQHHHHHQPGLMHQSQDPNDHPISNLHPHLHHNHLHHHSHLNPHQLRREDHQTTTTTTTIDVNAQPDSNSPLIAVDPALASACDNGASGRTGQPRLLDIVIVQSPVCRNVCRLSMKATKLNRSIVLVVKD